MIANEVAPNFINNVHFIYTTYFQFDYFFFIFGSMLWNNLITSSNDKYLNL